jgi:hypothetical protein
LSIEDIKNTYPFKVSGLHKTANDFKELLKYVITDYQTIELIKNRNENFSEMELKLIEQIIRYQKEVGAYWDTVRVYNPPRENYIMDEFTYKKQKTLLRKKAKNNKGIYYLPTVDLYTSTELYNKSNNKWGKKDLREYYGDIIEVVIKTLYLYDNTKIKFNYPYKVDNKRKNARELKELYVKARESVGTGKDFKLVYKKYYYSRETIRNINQIKRETQ